MNKNILLVIGLGFLKKFSKNFFLLRMIFIPRLFPNKQLKFYSDIYCLHPDKQHLIGEEETEIRIILMRKDRTKPVWSANFQMPASELLIE